MPTFVFRDGQLIDKRHAPPVPRQRSHLSAPMIISDHVDVVSMANGRRYDSKSEYYRDVKAAGYEVIGNDAPTTGHEMTTPGGVEADIKTAIEQIRGQT